MPRFAYSVRTPDDQRVAGVISAPDRARAMTELARHHGTVVRLEKIRLKAGSVRVSPEELITFTRQLAAAVRSGLPVKTALDIALDDADSGGFRRVLLEVASSVNEGQPLSQSLREHPRAFSKFYCSLVEAGEEGGRLAELLGRLADWLQRSQAFRTRVSNALYYPAVVLAFSLVAAAVMVVVGGPVLNQVQRELGLQLPALTRFLLAVGTWLGDYGLALMLGLGLALGGGLLFLRTSAGEELRDTWLLRLPLLGKLNTQLGLARFARSLSILYASGVDVLRALKLSAAASGNLALERGLVEVRRQVEQGEPLSAPLRRNPLFPRMTVGMVAAGEESGQLEPMLDSLAEFYELKAELGLQAFSRLIEPVLLISVGILMATAILGLGLPFMNLSQVM